MLLSLPFNNSIRVAIRIQSWTALSVRASLILIWLILSLCLFVESVERLETMKVHPAPKKRNITFRYDHNSSLSEANRIMNRQKKLRRLPHIFNRVLELPFRSDADVSVEENSDCFRFIVTTDDVGDDVRAHTIEIYPGVTKIVIRGTNVLELSLDELELDLWRFRLPPTTRPELATAVYVDGELIVTVPKGANADNPGGTNEEGEVWGEENGDLRGGVGRLVLVQ
ncbi:PREDICTED: uncharacterized protein LOC104598607 [Nelumbo nucifera]|uniref:Uncharacterized protein LOC104598607 n=1 Tax=Nelumbo nucifera TaxID=4432 RepID=A0A1U7ZYX0_NELNU|nr:PREDICTED: uncharacterized protein LOC104598607 [Nelumbo nucifera]